MKEIISIAPDIEQPLPKYQGIIGMVIIGVVSALSLYSMDKTDCSKEEEIFHDLITRASKSLQAIFLIREVENYQDTWAIRRGLT